VDQVIGADAYHTTHRLRHLTLKNHFPHKIFFGFVREMIVYPAHVNHSIIFYLFFETNEVVKGKGGYEVLDNRLGILHHLVILYQFESV
jgi:hypothetical protein